MRVGACSGSILEKSRKSAKLLNWTSPLFHARMRYCKFPHVARCSSLDTLDRLAEDN